MLTYKRDAFNGHELLFADWKRVSGLEKKETNCKWRVVVAATSQCNRDISYCVTVVWHLEPQIIVGRSGMVFKPCWKFG